MTNFDLGILGGGQLARMLALDAAPMGLHVSVMAAQAHDPAGQVVGSTVLGSLSDEADLRRFLRPLKNLTFESEFVDTDKLSRSLPRTVHVFPNLTAIEALQDRLTQKQLLDQFSIPTSPWREVKDLKDLHQAELNFKNGFVLKQRRFGYDGYGTFVVAKGQNADPSILQKSSHGFIAENFVKFRRELALSFVRSRSGHFLSLPLVESVQVNSRCFSVKGPIAHKSVATLTKKIRRMMESLDYVGILAVELFDTPKGLLVNEVAPRVHNSAHYSQDALTCSQFEYHIRAGLDLPLPKVELLKKGFAMVNLLGDGGREIHLSHSPLGHLHWYGKTENRAGRKLGHINVLESNPQKALQKALRWRKEFHL